MQPIYIDMTHFKIFTLPALSSSIIVIFILNAVSHSGLLNVYYHCINVLYEYLLSHWFTIDAAKFSSIALLIDFLSVLLIFNSIKSYAVI